MAQGIEVAEGMGVEITRCDRAACGYPDGNHFDWLRYDVAFKLACGRLPDIGRTQFTIENVRARPAPSPTRLDEARRRGYRSAEFSHRVYAHALYLIGDPDRPNAEKAAYQGLLH